MSEMADTRPKRTGVLLVKGLDLLTTPEQLTQHFGKYATISGVHIVKHNSGESRGFAYIMFQDSKEVARVTDHEHRILGKLLELELPSKKGRRRVCKSHVLHKRLYVYGLPSQTSSTELLTAFQSLEGAVDARVTVNPLTKELQERTQFRSE